MSIKTVNKIRRREKQKNSRIQTARTAEETNAHAINTRKIQ
jgi:hypothetical protein